MRLLLAVVTGLGIAACAEDPEERASHDSGADTADADTADADAADADTADAAPQHDAAATESQPICDGSQQIRFGYDWVDPTVGFVQYPFFEQYGPEFFFVRGDCHYVHGGSFEREFREGVLTPEQAEQLAGDTDFDTLPERFVRAKDDPCWDQATERIHGPSTTFSCRCCKVVEPISKLALGLAGEGTPVGGAVTAVATVYRNPEPDPARPSWPLSTDISEILVDRYTPLTEDGHRFEALDDSTALRALRNAQKQDDWVPTRVAVQDGEGQVFDVYVRDELPDDMEASVQRLLQEREEQR